MKREDLEKIEGLNKEAIDSIMALHGKDIETWKTKTTAAEQAAAEAKAQAEALTAQLADAGKQIEAFKGMDIDGIKKAADDWKAQAEKAQAEAKAQIEEIRLNTALEKALATFNVHDPADVLPHLKRDAIKLGENGQFVGLREQIEPLQTSKPYLFKAAADDPKIVDKTSPTSSAQKSALLLAAERGAFPERFAAGKKE